MHFLVLFIELFVTFVWCGLNIKIIFQRLIPGYLSRYEFLILSFGIAPYIITTILYYLFLLIPSCNISFYLSILLLLLIYPSVVFKRELIESLSSFIQFVKKQKKLILPILIFTCCWLFYISIKTITEHDTLEYAVQGKIFFRDRLINYSNHRIDNLSGFYYVGLHGFSFPLIYTFELMFNSIFNIESDYLFRIINSTYGILILLFAFEISRKRVNLLFGIVLTIILGLTYGFFETIMKYHIDMFRVFYIICSLYMMYLLVNKYSLKMLLLTSIFLAAQANSHSLGCMLSIIQFGLLMVFIQWENKNIILHFISAFLIFLLFGGIHYVLDVTIGTGWIFQEIKFY